MSILQTTELKKYYGAEPNITRALDGVTLSIEKGEFVAIVGTSGSGKSTLLNMIGGLDVPTSGQVVVDGKELSRLKDEELTVFRRRKIGFIFQNYNLVPVLNVFENIVLPVELDGNKVDKKFMKEVVQMLGLEDKLNNMPNNLYGGQQQRFVKRQRKTWEKVIRNQVDGSSGDGGGQHDAQRSEDDSLSENRADLFELGVHAPGKQNDAQCDHSDELGDRRAVELDAYAVAAECHPHAEKK